MLDSHFCRFLRLFGIKKHSSNLNLNLFCSTILQCYLTYLFLYLISWFSNTYCRLTIESIIVRKLLAELEVSYWWKSEKNLNHCLKIEEARLLKDFLTKRKLATWTLSLKFKITCSLLKKRASMNIL